MEQPSTAHPRDLAVYLLDLGYEMVRDAPSLGHLINIERLRWCAGHLFKSKELCSCNKHPEPHYHKGRVTLADGAKAERRRLRKRGESARQQKRALKALRRMRGEFNPANPVAEYEANK